MAALVPLAHREQLANAEPQPVQQHEARGIGVPAAGWSFTMSTPGRAGGGDQAAGELQGRPPPEGLATAQE